MPENRPEPCSDSDIRHLEISYREKLGHLQNPASYPESPEQLEIVETHMAWVFLAGRFAYKLKKPVFRPDQDYSTIDARHRDSQLELLLNRRLADDVYLGVEALRINRRGELELNGEGRACEWLLKMRRLPLSRMLDQLLLTRQADGQTGEVIGGRLGQFYRRCTSVAISLEEYRERFRRGIEANRVVLEQQPELRPALQIAIRQQDDFLSRRGQLLDDSIRQGRVRECHGDLRPEHVCVEGEVRIIDCLQFCRDYRLMDHFDDCAYLAMECERLGQPEVGAAIVGQVSKVTGATAPSPLLHFYQAYRATIRARLALLHLLAGSSTDRDKWLGQTRDYLAVAVRHGEQALQTD
ncbi:hypothetical protein F6455_18340 [Proteobacteria bacterium 005FR1]|nr:hypothetical protein [Proteobacteria bacterium 005FR1]